ncbi:hydroxymethylglutaryl-CoA lyase [Hephaestia caeni]|uniref:Hydroxymethylglutaryl-CoA lyase n=1 Tax=Hephaestia caeni TaxID=645617 RepID=A0A397NS03_9SPHN|nr:hydroxymethylglutaryl-CoA lyase [Hephaestia caeni]RIA37967.1 hydroxymethylglutaryl-CoA lyase [Hephaestia caeni]
MHVHHQSPGQSADSVTIIEVGPRDGFQSVGPYIPVETKLDVIGALHAAGVRRMEATSFVSQAALPQLADAEQVLAGVGALRGLDAQVLVPTVRHAERALAAGADHLSFVLSVSERHNYGNVRRGTLASVNDLMQIVALMPCGTRMRVNVATAFDCPHEGRVEAGAVLALVERLALVIHDAEFALCDTTGRANPAQVAALFQAARDRFPQIAGWAFHGHDTFGLGAANVWSAWQAGVRCFDAAVAGLGGCPYAPGATGNVATEDLVWMFEQAGIRTGIDLGRLAAVARDVVALPGAQTGGRVRDALAARACLPAGTVAA